MSPVCRVMLEAQDVYNRPFTRTGLVMKLLSFLLICTCLVLSGCGQKGPLVPPPATQTSFSR